MKYQKICINCPAGCHLEIEEDASGRITVTGNGCKRGILYAENELCDPKRIVTATVRCDDGSRVPVRTTQAISKRVIVPLLKKLYAMTVSAPFHRGDVLISDFEGSKADVIFSCSSEKKQKDA